MSSTSSIPIPTPRNGSGQTSNRHPRTSLRHASSSSFSTASPASSYGSPFSPSSTSPGGSSGPYVMGKGKGKGKQRAEEDGDEGVRPLRQPRRESLLGTSLSRSEHTVVDLGHYGGAPRLVSCVKSSQGFDWNQELFLPSYADYESHDLERRQDPVEDIVLTDEEVAAMFPQ